MGNYEDYFKSFAIKRFNDLTERKRKEGENPILNRKITEIKEYCYKKWLIELEEVKTISKGQLLLRQINGY